MSAVLLSLAIALREKRVPFHHAEVSSGTDGRVVQARVVIEANSPELGLLLARLGEIPDCTNLEVAPLG
jgi:hypothetical protein